MPLQGIRVLPVVTRRRGPRRSRGPRLSDVRHRSRPAIGARRRLARYLGGNWERGAFGARLAVGAWAVNPMTAQLIAAPSAPHAAGWVVAGVTPGSTAGL